MTVSETQIEWTDLNLCRRPKLQVVSVNHPMAGVAKCYSVRAGQPEVREIRKAPDVMDLQIAPSVVATMSAHKLISGHHIEAPSLVFLRVANPAPLLALAVDIARSFRTTFRIDAHGFGNLKARFQRSGNTRLRPRLPLVGGANAGFGLFRVLHALKIGHSALGAFPHLNSRARSAFRSKPVKPRSILTKFGDRFPILALGASLKPALHAMRVILWRQSSFLCRNDQCAFTGLSHVHPFPGISKTRQHLEHNGFPEALT